MPPCTPSPWWIGLSYKTDRMVQKCQLDSRCWIAKGSEASTFFGWHFLWDIVSPAQRYLQPGLKNSELWVTCALSDSRPLPVDAYSNPTQVAATKNSSHYQMFPGAQKPPRGKAGCHMVKTLKWPLGMSTWQGTEASCHQPGLTHSAREPFFKWIHQHQASFQMTATPADNLTTTTWEPLGWSHPGKLHPNSWATEAVRDKFIVWSH